MDKLTPKQEQQLKQLDEQFALGFITEIEYEQIRNEISPSPSQSNKTPCLGYTIIPLVILSCSFLFYLPHLLTGISWGLSHEEEYADIVLEITDVALILPKSKSLGSVLYQTRAKAYYNKNNYDETFKNLDLALELANYDKRKIAILTTRSLYYIEIRDYDKAIFDCEQTLAIDSSYSESYIIRATAHGNKKQYDKAISDLNTGLRLLANGDIKKKTIILAARSFYYIQMGEYDKAISDSEELLTMNPLNSSAYNNRGKAYSLQGFYELALSDFNKAIELNPSIAKIYCNRGTTYKELEMNQEAINDFKVCLALAEDADLKTLAQDFLTTLE